MALWTLHTCYPHAFAALVKAATGEARPKKHDPFLMGHGLLDRKTKKPTGLGKMAIKDWIDHKRRKKK